MKALVGMDRNAGLLLEDGTFFSGFGLGAENIVIGELCFNTAMTGYQETLTDPSYAGQIITFTYPHIGNVGTNLEDNERQQVHARGFVVRERNIHASNWRSASGLEDWARLQGITAIAGIDTRLVASILRDRGAMKAAIINPLQLNSRDKTLEDVQAWGGLEGLDLANEVTTEQPYEWHEGLWRKEPPAATKTVVAIDYGMKTNILRHLTTVEAVKAENPVGLFLSNGPGDPAATHRVTAPVIQWALDARIPLFGICLGHQLLALTFGGKTKKMKFGHHGVNHPVKQLDDGRVFITSMNHGFTVDASSLPSHVKETHSSLFDGTNCGLATDDGRAFSVQYHPEASPGPREAEELFSQFAKEIALFAP
jgi:carbamoyl-phosphate synthase small subunit